MVCSVRMWFCVINWSETSYVAVKQDDLVVYAEGVGLLIRICHPEKARVTGTWGWGLHNVKGDAGKYIHSCNQ
jgi:hypothetical protein